MVSMVEASSRSVSSDLSHSTSAEPSKTGYKGTSFTAPREEANCRGIDGRLHQLALVLVADAFLSLEVGGAPGHRVSGLGPLPELEKKSGPHRDEAGEVWNALGIRI